MSKVFKKINDKNIHRYAENQLELLILNGVFKPNEKLPAERVLSDQLNISRPTLRKAISHLTSLEILIVKRGGGTYVSNFLGDINTKPFIYLFKKYNKAALDFFELRYDIEGQAAYYAAIRATKSDKKILTICLDNLFLIYSETGFPSNSLVSIYFFVSICLILSSIYSMNDLPLVSMVLINFSLLSFACNSSSAIFIAASTAIFNCCELASSPVSSTSFILFST